MPNDDDQRHFAGLNARLLIDHVRARLGADGPRRLLEAAGETRPISLLIDDASWHSYEQFRRLLEAAAKLLGGVDALEHLDSGESLTRSTSPEIIQILLQYGSPLAMLRATANLPASIYPVLSLDVEFLGSSHVRWHRRMTEGYAPFPELCAFVRGMSPQSVRLFGLHVLEVVETQCQCRGDDECLVELRWDETEDLSTQLDLMRMRTDVAERRLAAFQQTVADLVSVDDLDTVLTKIVRSAARSIQAPGFVLSVDARSTGSRLYVDGVTLEEAERLISQDTGNSSVEVRSAHRSYGRLIAVTPGLHDPESLEAFARLAATALDSAFALEEARRQAQAAKSLLELSTSLVALTSVDELAAKLARAITDVIDCDCGAVIIHDGGVARVAGHYGYPEEAVRLLENFEEPTNEAGLAQLGRLSLQTRDDLAPVYQELMDSAGLKVSASAPLEVSGTVAGVLVASVKHGSGRILDDEMLTERFAGLAGQAAVALRNAQLLEQIRHQSLHDPLTDLPNRALLLDRADHMLARARRCGTTAAALFIDLDGFKQINDLLGHDVGDQLLQQVAKRLESALRAQDTIGRFGGDEFVALVECAGPEADVHLTAQRLIDAIREPVMVPGHDRPLRVGASVGVAMGDRPTANDLLRDADIALYGAKNAGKGCAIMFEAEMQTDFVRRTQRTDGLADALANDEFLLLYQPIYHLPTRTVIGAEALLRWEPQRDAVPPDVFIPILESTGLIVDVGRWVLSTACKAAARLQGDQPSLTMSVNTSIRQLERATFVAEVEDALAHSGIDPSTLVLEITESAMMRDPETTLATLHAIKALGVRIAIDDFGTGHSSLTYLQDFPLDAVKIDRKFVAASGETTAGRQMVRTLIELGRSLDLQLIAEGIEREEQMHLLGAEGCEFGQGFLLGRPVTADRVAELLGEQRSRAVPALPRPRQGARVEFVNR